MSLLAAYLYRIATVMSCCHSSSKCLLEMNADIKLELVSFDLIALLQLLAKGYFVLFIQVFICFSAVVSIRISKFIHSVLLLLLRRCSTHDCYALFLSLDLISAPFDTFKF